MAERKELLCVTEALLRPSDSAHMPRARPREETSATWSLLPLQNPMAVAMHRNIAQVSAASCAVTRALEPRKRPHHDPEVPSWCSWQQNSCVQGIVSVAEGCLLTGLLGREDFES